MTLVVVFPAKDGVVIGSDTQLTRGSTRCQDLKIIGFSPNCLWAAAGDIPLIQRFKKELNKTPAKKKSLESTRDEISQIIKKVMSQAMKTDVRFDMVSHPTDLLRLYNLEIIFAEYTNTPTIYHYLNTGVSEILERPHAIGVGHDFAFALLQKYENTIREFDTDKALILVYKILNEAIKVGAYDINFPIDIWVIKSNGAKPIQGEELDTLHNKFQELQDKEVKLLIP